MHTACHTASGYNSCVQQQHAWLSGHSLQVPQKALQAQHGDSSCQRMQVELSTLPVC